MSDTRIARELLAVFAAHPATPMPIGQIRHEVAEAIGGLSFKELRPMLDQLVRGRVISYVRNERGHRLYLTYDPAQEDERDCRLRPE